MWGSYLGSEFPYFFGTDFTDYTVFCLEELTHARIVRDVGARCDFFLKAIGIKGVYESYWRLGDWLLFLVVQILFKQLTKF